jgi:hypothetical protein
MFYSAMLSTKRKMAVARLLNRVIVGAKTTIVLSSRVTVCRRNVKWSLDLDKGSTWRSFSEFISAFPNVSFNGYRPDRWSLMSVLILELTPFRLRMI